MTKKISIIITISFLLLSAGCSTYNSLVPNWATITSSSSTETTESNTNKDTIWWNPFSWF